MNKKVNLSKSDYDKLKILLNKKYYHGLLSFKEFDSAITPKDDRFQTYAKQLLTQGFDETETWSLKNTLAEWLIPRLICFKKVKGGYPYGITYKISKNKTLTESEAWDKVLDEIIWYLKEIATNYQTDTKLRNKYGYKKYNKKCEQYTKRLINARKLFFEYLEDLWW